MPIVYRKRLGTRILKTFEAPVGSRNGNMRRRGVNDCTPFLFDETLRGLEGYSRLDLKRSRCDEMCTAERREEVIQSDLVRDVDSCEPECHLRMFTAK